MDVSLDLGTTNNLLDNTIHKQIGKLCFLVNPRPTEGGGYFEPSLSFSCDIF